MQNEKLYLEIIDNLTDGIYFVDAKRCITLWNKAAEDITGYKKEEMLGKYCEQNLLRHIDKSGAQLCIHGCPLHQTLNDGKQRKAHVFLRHKDGGRIPISVNIFPIIDEGMIIGAVEIFTPDSTVVYDDDLIEQMSNLLMNDELTGLANRRKVESYVGYKLHEFNNFKNQFCLMFMDIDDFSKVNNTYGHVVGDEVLKRVSQTILNNIRNTDLFGRWGGEEFVGIFNLRQKSEAEGVAEKIRMLVQNSEVQHNDEIITVSASLGVTIPREDDTVESIIERADQLMYESKKRNKNCVTSDI